jgi:integrase
MGLVLEVRRSGGKTWYLRYTDDAGSQRALKLGSQADLSFSKARALARKRRSEVLLGDDPLSARKAKRATPQFGALAAQHIEHAKSYQRSWWSVAGILNKHLLPRFAKHRLDQITSQEVARFLADKAAEGLKPATVEKIRVVLGRSFELARQWNMPGSEVNPVRNVPRPRFSNARSRYLNASEAARLLRAADRSPQPQLKPIIQLLLMTGCRKSELLQARWEHVDLERRSWLIPMSKSGKARHVPLSQVAVDVLEALPRLPGCDLVVPNLASGEAFRDIKKAWDTVRRDACLSDVRLHDLRHSAASFMINAGVDLYTVGRVLGHAQAASSQRYSHLSDATLLAAVEAGASKLNAPT